MNRAAHVTADGAPEGIGGRGGARLGPASALRPGDWSSGELTGLSIPRIRTTRLLPDTGAWMRATNGACKGEEF